MPLRSRSIDITMKPAYRKFNYLYIPVALKGFFPSGEAKTEFPIVVETDKGNFDAVLQYNSRANV